MRDQEKDDQENSEHGIGFGRLFCDNCGSAWQSDAVSCLNCGHEEYTEDGAYIRPGSPRPARDNTRIDIWPLTGLKFPSETPMVLDGGPGTGKTTMLMLMQPNGIWSTEQKVPALTDRLHDLGIPESGIEIKQVKGKYPVPDQNNYLLGVDSITSASMGEEWYHELIEWSTEPEAGRRLVAILQNIKAGVYAGSAELPHGADICVHLERDWVTGLCIAEVWKNRHGALMTRYYSVGETVTRPDFNGPYALKNSKEGPRICEAGSRGSVYAEHDDSRCKAYVGCDKKNLIWEHIAARFTIDNGICWRGPNPVHVEGCPHHGESIHRG